MYKHLLSNFTTTGTTVREGQMSDIVERLREQAEHWTRPALVPGYLREAADEIVRLRALIARARSEMVRREYTESCADDAYGPELRELREWLIEARRALEGK